MSAHVAESMRFRAETSEALRRLDDARGGRPPHDAREAVWVRWGLPIELDQ